MAVLAASFTEEARSLEERFLGLGIGNLDSGAKLFELMANRTFPADWNRCLPAASLVEHGVELFLKGAIWHVAGDPEGTHDLENLFNRFRNLYPGNQFEFKSRIVDLIRTHPLQPFAEFYRYPIDKQGTLLHKQVFFDAAVWAQESRSITSECEAMMQLIIDRYQYVTVEAKLLR